MEERNALLRKLLGTAVHAVIDRPIGYCHKGILYPVNYGYIPGIIAGDGEAQDVYILGTDQPLKEFDGIVIGAAVRRDDCEDKLIAVPAGMHFTREQMAQAIRFQEQYFHSHVILPGEV